MAEADTAEADLAAPIGHEGSFCMLGIALVYGLCMGTKTHGRSVDMEHELAGSRIGQPWGMALDQRAQP